MHAMVFVYALASVLTDVCSQQRGPDWRILDASGLEDVECQTDGAGHVLP